MLSNGMQGTIVSKTSQVGNLIKGVKTINFMSHFNLGLYNASDSTHTATDILSRCPQILKSNALSNYSLIGQKTADAQVLNIFRESDASRQYENPIQNTSQVVSSGSTSLIVKPLHILLVTETWSPDVNGVAMSLGQLMNQLAMSGNKVSLLRPKPKTLHSIPDTDSAKTNGLKTDQNDDLNNDLKSTGLNSSELNSKWDNKREGNTLNILIKPQVNNQTSTQFISNDIQVKGMAIPKYTDLQFGLPAYFTIKKAMKQLNPDVVHIATEGPLGLAALLAAKSLKIPATTGYHTQFHDFSRHFGLGVLAGPLMAYFKWFHNASKATCVPSQKTFKDLDILGFKRLVEVGRGVDLELFNPEHRSEELRQTWGAQQHHTVLVMVSRLSPEKGVDLVIKSFKALQRQQLHRAVKLVIVGDGPDRQRLESLAADNSEDILFTGSKTGVALSQHYASGDAFIFASQVETFGNVVVEAMASGLPVYAFDDAAAAMLVTMDNGKLAPMGDKQAFIEMVASLPKMQVLKDQGCKATKSVADFSWKRPAQHMLTMFNEAISYSSKF